MCTCGRKLCGGYFLDSLQIEGIPCRPLLAGGNYIDDRWSGNVSVIPRFLSDQTYVYKYVLFLKPKQMLVSFEVNPSSMLPGNSELWVQPEWKGTFRSSTFNILITRRKDNDWPRDKNGEVCGLWASQPVVSHPWTKPVCRPPQIFFLFQRSWIVVAFICGLGRKITRDNCTKSTRKNNVFEQCVSQIEFHYDNDKVLDTSRTR